MVDKMFDALADVHRRRLLVDLLDHNPQPVPETSSVSRISAEADGKRIRMQHVHLPKLVDYGFVEWDREEGVVTKGPQFDELKPLLTLLDDHRDELPAEWL